MVVSFIGGGNRSTKRKSPPQVTHKLYSRMLLCRVHLASAGFELTTLVMSGTECICSYKSNYHSITSTTARGQKDSELQSYNNGWVQFEFSWYKFKPWLLENFGCQDIIIQTKNKLNKDMILMYNIWKHWWTENYIIGVMVRIIASSTVDCRFGPWLGKIKDYEIVFVASPLNTQL